MIYSVPYSDKEIQMIEDRLLEIEDEKGWMFPFEYKSLKEINEKILRVMKAGNHLLFSGKLSSVATENGKKIMKAIHGEYKA
jgi:hypothetical protein